MAVWPAVGDAGSPAVHVVDTESRRLSAGDAATRVTQAVRACRTPRYFKKIDSTLRGPLGAEIEAVMAASGTTRALVCPAFPAQRRTVVGGALLIDGVPIGRTGMQATSSVIELLRPQLTRAIVGLPLSEVRAGHGRLADRLMGLDGMVIVADAETDADLTVLVEASLSLAAPPVLAGAAGLGRALAARLGILRDHAPLPRARRWLIVAGSLHPATRRQADAARNAGLIVLASAPGESPDDGAAARRLADEARQRLRAEAFDVVVVTGGDTALALYDALGRGRLELVGPPAPGLALARLTVPGRDALWLVTKAGGFGDPDLIVSLAKEAA